MKKLALIAAFLLAAWPSAAQQVKLLEDVPAGAASQPAGQDEMPQVILPSETTANEAPPAEPKPVKAKPAVKKAKPAAKKSSKAPAVSKTVAPAPKPAETKPAEAKPAAATKPAEAKPAVKPAPAAAKPEAKPVEAKPAVKPAAAAAKLEAKPAEAKPAVKPAPAAAKPVETKPAVKPAVAAKPEAKPVEAKPEVKPAAAAAGFSVQKKHTVTGGDTLWDLSGKYYKDPYKWGKIYNANLDRVNNPDLIYPRNELVIPDLTEEVKPEVKPAAAVVPAGDDTVKEPELQASEVAQPEEQLAPLPPPGKPAAAELKEALAAYEKADLSEEMPDHQKEWGTGVRVVPDGWEEDGVIAARDPADDDSLEESLSLDGAVMRLSMEKAGTRRGDMLTVYMIGSDAFDKNGKRIGREIQRVGTLEVLEADGRKAKARVIEAITGIVKGYVVKKK